MALNISDALSQNVVDKRIDVLQRIKQFGSISEAARSAGISYKAAWQAIETLSALAGEPLVEKSVGGNTGGGARITPAGEAVLERQLPAFFYSLPRGSLKTATVA